MTLRRAWAAWTCLSIITGYTVAWAIGIAYAGRVIEATLAGFCWGFGYAVVTPSVLRWVGRLVR